MNPVWRWVHVIGVSTYIASTIVLLIALLPAAKRMADPEAQRTMLARWLNVYNLLSVGALLVLLLSGGSMVTDLKAAMGANFIRLIWWLTAKLSLSFLLIFFATWMSFGLAHRVVRAERGLLDVDPAWQRSILARMRGVGWFNLALAVATGWVGSMLRG